MIHTGRPVTMAPNGVVTSPHSLASSAGVDVLRAGGSAVDAAIATSAALAVLYPHMTGIGGDAFWLIHDAKTGKVRHLNGGGRAAASANVDWFRSRGHEEIPFRGVLPATVTTPGSVASWAEAHQAYGRLPLRRCLETAIGYAREGFPVTARLSGWIAQTAEELARQADIARIFLPAGEVPQPGSRLVNADLARTLDAIADRGSAGFYEGDVARELDRFARDNGGFFREADLRSRNATWGEPLVGRYRDLVLYETPPPTQGFTVLQMLKLIEPFELHKREFLGADHAHLLVQAKQLAYNDRDRFLADPAFAHVPIDELLSDAYVDRRRAFIDPAKALPWDRVPSHGSLTGDTVFVAVVDAEGNAVSLIQSLYGVFGSAVVAGSTGVVLQNRGAYFSLDPSHPNCLEPGKIPLHTLIASIGFRPRRAISAHSVNTGVTANANAAPTAAATTIANADAGGPGQLWSVLGCMGADGQPQIHLQTYVAMIDYGCDIQQALEAPRWLSGRFALGQARDTLHIEGRFPAHTLDELDRRGHILDRWGPWNELAGHAHGIVIDPVSGMRCGGSDPRSDGAAIGY